MTTSLTDRRRAKRLLLTQLAVALGISAGLLGWEGMLALSALAGGLISVVANTAMAVLAFRNYRAQEPGLILSRFYSAELLKLIVTASGFAVAFFAIDSLQPVALLLTFFVVQVLPAMFVR